MRRRLQARKDRGKQRDLKDLNGMSEEEQKAALETQTALLQADRQREDNTVVDAMQDLERVGLTLVLHQNPFRK